MRVQERQQGSQPALPALPKASASLLCGSDDGGSSSDSDAGPKDRGMQPAAARMMRPKGIGDKAGLAAVGWRQELAR
eukprot:scaffold120233_cov18-Tisochrysis_lutea.AAC.1